MREDAARALGETDANFREFLPGRPLRSLLATTQDVLLTPRRFFGAMPPDEPIRGPLVYLLLCYLVCSLLGILSFVVLFFSLVGIVVPIMQTSDGAELGDIIGRTALLSFYGLLLCLGLNLISMLFFVLWIPVQHAFVLLFARGSQRGINATIRFSCYGGGATILLACMPVVGLLAIPYSFYLLVAGLKRVHRTSDARALAAGLTPTALTYVFLSVASVAALWYAADTPAVAALGTWGDASTSTVSYEALEVGHPDHDDLRELRADLYEQDVPRAEYGIEVMVSTSTPPGEVPQGVVGRATDSGQTTVTIDSRQPTRGIGQEGDSVRYYASIPDAGNVDTGDYGTLCQGFMFDSPGAHTVELEQVGEEWHTLHVRAFTALNLNAQEAEAYFTMSYAAVQPGSKFRLKLEPDAPFSDLVLEVDSDADGSYEEKWIPDATVYGDATNDSEAPTTTARLGETPDGDDAVVLQSEDTGDPNGTAPASGTGITYFYINDRDPSVYTGPIPIEEDDEITYFSIDRAGNIEGVQDIYASQLTAQGKA